MSEITLDQAQLHLGAIIGKLQPGEELIITQQNKPIARLVTMMQEKSKKPQRQLGTAKGQLRIISEDDEHLADFSEYMQ